MRAPRGLNQGRSVLRSLLNTLPCCSYHHQSSCLLFYFYCFAWRMHLVRSVRYHLTSDVITNTRVLRIEGMYDRTARNVGRPVPAELTRQHRWRAARVLQDPGWATAPGSVGTGLSRAELSRSARCPWCGCGGSSQLPRPPSSPQAGRRGVVRSWSSRRGYRAQPCTPLRSG